MACGCVLLCVGTSCHERLRLTDVAASHDVRLLPAVSDRVLSRAAVLSGCGRARWTAVRCQIRIERMSERWRPCAREQGRCHMQGFCLHSHAAVGGLSRESPPKAFFQCEFGIPDGMILQRTGQFSFDAFLASLCSARPPILPWQLVDPDFSGLSIPTSYGLPFLLRRLAGSGLALPTSTPRSLPVLLRRRADSGSAWLAGLPPRAVCRFCPGSLRIAALHSLLSFAVRGRVLCAARPAGPRSVQSVCSDGGCAPWKPADRKQAASPTVRSFSASLQPAG